jgi:hypothetical protein
MAFVAHSDVSLFFSLKKKNKKQKTKNHRKLNSWRHHPSIRPTSIKYIMPGLGTASVAFAAYVGVEWLLAPAHHDDHH